MPKTKEKRQISLSDLIILIDLAKHSLAVVGKQRFGFRYTDEQLLTALNHVLKAIGKITFEVKS